MKTLETNNICTNCGGRGYFVHHIHEYDCNICKGTGKKYMKTFKELSEKTTPDIIKRMCELAEGFEILNFIDSRLTIKFDELFIEIADICFHSFLFPLLLHRAVEGWNKSNTCMTNITTYGSRIEYGAFDEKNIYFFEDYEASLLTQEEMALWDCLINVLGKRK